ncbi:hypothetical protein [Salinibacter altiplanensis]|uniref:hypothetical protein n=1 Tax=Salinibacter altiplanensis TaxID=1803181 RepID=UPI000C9FE3F0|nr:hypothetical protein [Salinibacter altiplanensis]
MYEFQGIDFGPTEVTVEADTLRGALDQMGQLYNLHKDALFLEAHVKFFYDTQAEVVPRSRDDDEGFQYRGFECLRTGCNITFKETEEDSGIYPGRYRAYRNGEDNPKLYDPQRSHEDILGKVSPQPPHVQRFGVDVGQNGNRQNGNRQNGSGRGESAANPSGTQAASSTAQNGTSGSSREQHESEKMYDKGSQSAAPKSPTKEQAASSLVAKAQKHTDDTLAGKAQVNGTTLDQKLKGLAEYCNRDDGYVARVLDALQLQSFEQVAVGQVETVAQMLLHEDVLQQNEEFEADDDLPF